MKLNYPEEEFDKIPEDIKRMHNKDLDFTEDNPDRDLHKREMDRRIYYGTHFLSDYTWDGEKKDNIENKSSKGLSRWS